MCYLLSFVCFQDILKDQWSPALTIKTALLSLQALMCSAEPGDPQDAEVGKCTGIVVTCWPALVCLPRVDIPHTFAPSHTPNAAKMYTTNRPEFDRTAKFWTDSYAKPSSKEDAVSRVCEMGFDRASARKALEKNNWDESAAVNALLGGM